jgi:glycosyltransferase involved in cell wall biosynthesis
MSIGVYEAGDTGPSGHGQVFRGHVAHLLDDDALNLTVRTHDWGWNREGIAYKDSARRFTDSRFRERVINSLRFNEDYLVESRQEAAERPDDLLKHMGTAGSVRSSACPVREITDDDEMDVWHTVGGMGFADQAPDDDGTYTIVETDFNLDVVPRSWPSYARDVDEVWVPNEWNYEAWERRGYTENVRVVPYGVDFSYRPTTYDCHSCPAQMHTAPPGGGGCLDDEAFTFGAVLRWYHIKGADRLIEAYLREFSGDEDVRLFLKTTMNNQAPLNGEKVHQVVRAAADELGVDDVPEMGFRTDPMSDQRFMDLLGVFDGFVMPSRAECVGIAWVQAMHAGTPVITTDWSAMSEYLTDDHAVLVSEGEVETPRPYQESITYAGSDDYPADAHWFDPDVDALRRALRRVYEMPEGERQRMTEKAREHVHDVFDWKRCIEQRKQRMVEVAGGA